jgi:hypothetical protein
MDAMTLSAMLDTILRLKVIENFPQHRPVVSFDESSIFALPLKEEMSSRDPHFWGYSSAG